MGPPPARNKKDKLWGRRKVKKKNQKSQRDAEGEAEEWHELKERLNEPFSERLGLMGLPVNNEALKKQHL